jgi:hypothetical protein
LTLLWDDCLLDEKVDFVAVVHAVEASDGQQQQHSRHFALTPCTDSAAIVVDLAEEEHHYLLRPPKLDLYVRRVVLELCQWRQLPNRVVPLVGWELCGIGCCNHNSDFCFVFVFANTRREFSLAQASSRPGAVAPNGLPQQLRHHQRC